MKLDRPSPTGRETTFSSDELIVSKTDLRGRITYANDVFQRVSGFTEAELLGQPHNVIRHPDMPGCVFKLLWDTVQRGEEIFAYVVNLCRDGSHYWVLAHVTPSFDAAGKPTGYHSNRRVPFADALPRVQSLYDQLNAAERKLGDRRSAIAASHGLLEQTLSQAGMTYSQFIFSLSRETQLRKTP